MTTDEAIAWGGGTQHALAARLGIKQPSVANWGDYPPALRQFQIERLSGGALKAEPGCYGAASSVPEAA